MAEANRTIRATCLCGAARHEITLPEAAFPILGACLCHCTSCRRMTGSFCFSSIPLLTDEDYRPSQRVLENLTPFEFSKDRITHYFCTTCGSHMLAHVLPRERNTHIGIWFAANGTLENAKGAYWPRHEYVGDTLDGGLADLLPSINGKLIERWHGHPGDGEQLPLRWRDPDTDESGVLTPSSTKLYARCKCGGIEFWIARPADGSKYEAKISASDSFRLGNGMQWFVSGAAQIPSSQIFLDEDGLIPYQKLQTFGTMKTYRSSATIQRCFCGTCGAAIFLAREGTDMMTVAIGILAAPEGARAETWLDWSLEELQSVEI